MTSFSFFFFLEPSSRSTQLQLLFLYKKFQFLSKVPENILNFTWHRKRFLLATVLLACSCSYWFHHLVVLKTLFFCCLESKMTAVFLKVSTGCSNKQLHEQGVNNLKSNHQLQTKKSSFSVSFSRDSGWISSARYLPSWVQHLGLCWTSISHGKTNSSAPFPWGLFTQSGDSHREDLSSTAETLPFSLFLFLTHTCM